MAWVPWQWLIEVFAVQTRSAQAQSSSQGEVYTEESTAVTDTPNTSVPSLG